MGAKYLPSAELNSIVINGSRRRCYCGFGLPIFGINEVPSFTVILGGGIVITSSSFYFMGYGARKKRDASFDPNCLLEVLVLNFFLVNSSFDHAWSKALNHIFNMFFSVFRRYGNS